MNGYWVAFDYWVFGTLIAVMGLLAFLVWKFF